MHFELEISMDNAAFDDPGELPNLLRKLANTIRANPDEGQWRVMDSNGNTVGIGRYVGRKES